MNRDMQNREGRPQISLYVIGGTDRSGRSDRIRKVLSTHFGEETNREDIHLCKTEKGQPYLSNHTYASITDSHDFWIMAVSDVPVGIDLQFHGIGTCTDPKKLEEKCVKLARRFFHPEEADAVMGQSIEAVGSDLQRIERFYRIWTAKEAYVKFTGQGIDREFSQINVLAEELQKQLAYPAFAAQYTLCICAAPGVSYRIHRI